MTSEEEPLLPYKHERVFVKLKCVYSRHDDPFLADRSVI